MTPCCLSTTKIGGKCITFKIIVECWNTMNTDRCWKLKGQNWSVLKAEKLLNLWIRRYARKCSLNSCKVWLFIAVNSTFLPGRFVKAESWKLKGEYWSVLKAEKLLNLGIRHYARNCSLNSCKVWLFIAVHSTFLPGRFVNLFGTR